MKFLKKLFYGIAGFVMVACAIVLILAFSPELTGKLADALYGENGFLNKLGIHLEHKPEADGGKKKGSTLVLDEKILKNYEIADGVLADGGFSDYMTPVSGEMNLSSKMKKKSGYRPVKAYDEILEDTQANQLLVGLDTKETGENLRFESDVYPYYGMLGADMQNVYRQIYANADALNDRFAPVEKITPAQLKNVFEAVNNDHPELFWLKTEYNCKYRSDGNVVEIGLLYHPVANDLESAKTRFEAAAEAVLRQADAATKEEQAKQIHDALLARVEYSAKADMNQSAYSALVDGKTVCAGYARAYQYLMQKSGNTCYYCTGYSGEDHAWNIVQLSDVFSNVDPTWDDTDPVSYDYYVKSDAEFVGTHIRTGMSVYLPACTGEAAGAQSGKEVAGITINSKPSKPLSWESESPAASAQGEGIQTLDDYYADCLAKIKSLGAGQRSFSNEVPKTVFEEAQKAYANGSYKSQYVNQALKDLKMDHFAIQIQVIQLKDDRYRLIHNIYIW